MQKKFLDIKKQKNNALKEVQVVIQSMEEAELEIHALQTGQIILSHKEDCSMEGMLCTGEILGGMCSFNVRIYICELKTEQYDYLEKKWTPLDLSYDFFKSCYTDTVITELDIQLTNNMTGDILPIRICALKLCFEDGKELDYSDKISVFVLNNLAKAA